MERNIRPRLWDFARYWYNIKNIMLNVNVPGDLFFMCNVMHSDNISLGEYLDAYDFFDRNKPLLRKAVSNSKSIRSVCISTNKKRIRDTSSNLHKLSEFK